MKRGLWILLAALLALPIADALLWRFAAARLASEFEAWSARAQGDGWTVTHGRLVPGGWPLSATLDIANVTLSRGAAIAPGGYAWHAAGIRLGVTLWRPRSMTIDALGDQTVRVGLLPPVGITADRLIAMVGLQSSDEARAFELQADRLRIAAAADPDIGHTFAAEQLRCQISVEPHAGQGDAAVEFSITADNLALMTAVRWPLGPSVTSLAVDGSLVGPLPPAQPVAAWAAAWRDGGGSLQLQHLAVNWGPLNMTGSATLALDDQLQPMGAGTTRVTGYAETLDALASGGTLSRSAAIAAKAVLSLLAGAPDDGSAADVEVPLTLQYRTLSMRQVPLVRLPELELPGQ